MTAIIGKLSEFDAGKELVLSYIERTQLFFEANNIEGKGSSCICQHSGSKNVRAPT